MNSRSSCKLPAPNPEPLSAVIERITLAYQIALEHRQVYVEFVKTRDLWRLLDEIAPEVQDRVGEATLQRLRSTCVIAYNTSQWFAYCIAHSDLRRLLEALDAGAPDLCGSPD